MGMQSKTSHEVKWLKNPNPSKQSEYECSLVSQSARYTKTREYSGLARNVSNDKERGMNMRRKNRKRELKRQKFPNSVPTVPLL